MDENGNNNNNNIHISKNFPRATYAPYADFIYLGEICPIKRKHCYPLPNINCQSLVVDTLFANPNLNFPNQKIELDRLIKWIFNEISEHPVVIFCGELGKPQLIAAEIFSYLKEHNELNTENGLYCISPTNPYASFDDFSIISLSCFLVETCILLAPPNFCV